MKNQILIFSILIIGMMLICSGGCAIFQTTPRKSDCRFDDGTLIIHCNKAIAVANNVFIESVDENENSFFYRECADSIYVWTYSSKNGLNYITMNYINPHGDIYSLTKKYPYSIDWLFNQNSIDQFIEWSHSNNSKANQNIKEFAFVSNKIKNISLIHLLSPHQKCYTDTLLVPFLSEYSRDYTQYIKPFVKRMSSSNNSAKTISQ